MKKITYIAFCVFCTVSFKINAQVSLTLKKPLSEEDAMTVKKILSTYDPNSYKFTTDYNDSKGNRKSLAAGKASLASIKQSNTKFAAVSKNAASTNTNNNVFKAASTNTNNNIFKTASTNTNNNIFKVASTNTNNNIFKVASTNTNNNIFKVASTNTNNNVFKTGSQAASELNQLNAILSKYQ